MCDCAGVQAPLSFTLGYAAPEVAIALTAGMEVVQAEPAMDAWAIGVIAFELLTGRPAFRMEHGKQDVSCSPPTCVWPYVYWHTLPGSPYVLCSVVWRVFGARVFGANASCRV